MAKNNNLYNKLCCCCQKLTKLCFQSSATNNSTIEPTNTEPQITKDSTTIPDMI